MKYFLLLTALALSCKPTNKTERELIYIASVDSLYDTDAGNASTRLIEQEHHHLTKNSMESLEMEQSVDSVILAKTIKIVLLHVLDRKNADELKEDWDTVHFHFGHLFSTSQKHLVVTRLFPWHTSTNIYRLHNDSLQLLLTKEFHPLSYIGDSITDINGDGHNDYLCHWYPLSGCCPRKISDVYLETNNGLFSDEFEFINATFHTKQGIVTGLMYGYWAPFYQYKWNGQKLDTIEIIERPDSLRGEKFILRKYPFNKNKPLVLDSLPSIYNEWDNY